MTTLTGVGAVLSCAHRPINADVFGGEVHGHSYEIIAWFENDDGSDVRIFQAALNALLKQWDHKMLPDELATGEAIARAVGCLNKVVEVDVRRPLERLYARWRVPQPAPTQETGWGWRAKKNGDPVHDAVMEDLARRIDDE